MSPPSRAPEGPGGPAGGRRPYDSTRRRAQAAQTRERIVAAGAELAHSFASWDWRDLTVRAVARRAGVNERTVYRHFTSERELHDAVMHRLEEEAGDPLEGLVLDDIARVTERVFGYLSSFALSSREPSDPTFVAVDRRRRDALVAALEPATAGWTEVERRMAAGLLDVLWSLAAYERLTAAWSLEPADATDAIAGLLRLLVDAIGAGRRPWTGP